MNHLLGHCIPFKTMKLNKSNDWKNSQLNASTHCFIKNFTKSYKSWSTFLKICAFTYSIFGQMDFRKNILVKKKKSLQLLLFMLCHLVVYETLQNTLFLSHLVKNKVITNPNLSKFYGRQRDWKKLHPDFARIPILVNQPGLNKLSFKMTRLNRLIIYQFFRAVHAESK